MIERLIHIIIKPLTYMSEIVDEVAEGDFTRVIIVKGNDEISQMSNRVKNLVGTMNDTMNQINVSSELVKQEKGSQ